MWAAQCREHVCVVVVGEHVSLCSRLVYFGVEAGKINTYTRSLHCTAHNQPPKRTRPYAIRFTTIRNAFLCPSTVFFFMAHSCSLIIYKTLKFCFPHKLISKIFILEKFMFAKFIAVLSSYIMADNHGYDGNYINSIKDLKQTE